MPDAETASKYHLYHLNLDLVDNETDKAISLLDQSVDEKAESFADALGLPKNCRVGYVNETIHEVPSVENGLGESEQEDTVDDFDIDDQKDPKTYGVSPEDLEKATQPVRSYIESLGLGFKATYGGVKVANFRMKNPNDFNTKTPGEYSVPVALTDSDETTIMFDIFVDAQTFEMRHTSWNHETKLEEESLYWKPTKEQIQAAMAGRKQHYVLVVTKDVDTAKRLTEQLYADTDVVTAASGHRRILDRMNSNALMAHIHGFPQTEGPEQFLIKPEEEKRQKLLEKTYIKG